MLIASAPPAVVPAIIVAGFALGTALGFVLVQKALTVRAAFAPDAGSGAADTARAALDAIPVQAEQAAAYAQLAGAVRDYLDARFGIDSSTMPGPEVERAMTRGGVTRPAARMTAHLLERCERMQRAGAERAGPERIAADVASAREIIDLTSSA